MKNKFIKKIIVLGGLSALLFAGTQGVNADWCGDNTCGFSVVGEDDFDITTKVGDVETPYYSVVISWDDMIFNWSYNGTTKEYEWKVNPSCNLYGYEQEEIENALASGIILYADENCENGSINEYDENVGNYYYKKENTTANIYIEDNSKGGSEIVPSITWTPSEQYNYVEGKFTYTGTKCTVLSSQEELNSALEINVPVYSDSVCETKVANNPISFEAEKYYAFIQTNGIELMDAEVTENGRQCMAGDAYSKFTEQTTYPKNHYELALSLKNNEDAQTITPTKGDTLGTITITLKAKDMGNPN